jgi:hypothetical protein
MTRERETLHQHRDTWFVLLGLFTLPQRLALPLTTSEGV